MESEAFDHTDNPSGFLTEVIKTGLMAGFAICSSMPVLLIRRATKPGHRFIASMHLIYARSVDDISELFSGQSFLRVPPVVMPLNSRKLIPY
jgi:hypothetical protein